ncbi:carboxylesterase/lipase family protein [Paeniglutamicibacter cryotolerans]|uniref:Carboxylic ester hydrolase n=1 Tax=Paeniglutamicibacter cryotolerans TaxID=670079 RepID=A0A839QNK9_9MICC|nr:carboxylesterase family protein [Paeniglutamicibacter cryotolerans]MBB2996364.1 para-nitrobenzyl esterase [Paeniglutamicibacter cryotolerans]
MSLTHRSDAGERLLVYTASGPVRGIAAGGIHRFLGIPYAAAPVGMHRFGPPARAPEWVTEFDASTPGPTAPQVPYPGALGRLLPSVRVPGDGYLNLNICVPAEPGKYLRPVLVFFHGGGLTRGSNAIEGYDGGAFARDGLIFVAPNYRLGAEGFGVLDGAPLNRGLADQLAALDWVARNIRAFGGDPARVTVVGHSAGGNTVAALLAHQRAASLIQRAIIQSAPLNALPSNQSARATHAIAHDLGIDTTRPAFSEVPAADILAAQTRVAPGGGPLSRAPGFSLSIGLPLIPRSPDEALEHVAGGGIDLLIGTTSEEARLWLVPTGLADRVDRLALALARHRLHIPAETLRLFRSNRPGASNGEVLGAVFTEQLLRIPAHRLADARLANGGSTYVYEFGWPSPVQRLGAAHAVELGFVFDHLGGADAVALVGPDAPQALADAMHGAWVSFATTGNPGWRPWDAMRPVKTFDGAGNSVIQSPRESERLALLRGDHG